MNFQTPLLLSNNAVYDSGEVRHFVLKQTAESACQRLDGPPTSIRKGVTTDFLHPFYDALFGFGGQPPVVVASLVSLLDDLKRGREIRLGCHGGLSAVAAEAVVPEDGQLRSAKWPPSLRLRQQACPNPDCQNSTLHFRAAPTPYPWQTCQDSSSARYGACSREPTPTAVKQSVGT